MPSTPEPHSPNRLPPNGSLQTRSSEDFLMEPHWPRPEVAELWAKPAEDVIFMWIEGE
jgi:hypothetical protein